jgi:hypothetical protein
MKKAVIIGPLLALLCALCIYLLSDDSYREIKVPISGFDTTHVQTIHIDLNSPPIPLDSLIEEVRYVALENMEHSKIIQTAMVFIDDDLILVLDSKGQKVVGFDLDGNYQFNVYKKGKGKREYKYMEYAIYDYLKKEVLVVDTWKYIWYDLKGNYLRSYKSQYNFNDNITLLANSQLAYYREFGNIDRSTNPADLNILDSSGTLMSRFLPTELQNINHRATLMNGGMISNKKAGAIIRPTYSNLIYELLSDQRLILKYRIDLGPHQLPDDYRSTVLTNPELNFGLVRKFENENKWASLGHLTDNPEFLCLDIHLQSKNYQAYYSKKSQSTRYIEVGSEQLFNGSYFFHATTFQEYFVSWVMPEDLREGLKEGEVTDPETIKFIQGLNNGNNPVLRMIKIRDF